MCKARTTSARSSQLQLQKPRRSSRRHTWMHALEATPAETARYGTDTTALRLYTFRTTFPLHQVATIRQRYYWLGIDSMVLSYAKTCKECRCARVPAPKYKAKPIISTRPLHRVVFDFAELPVRAIHFCFHVNERRRSITRSTASPSIGTYWSSLTTTRNTSG